MTSKTTFAVPAKGIGRKDYSTNVEHSTAALVTPSLRQQLFVAVYVGVLPCLAFPEQYQFPLPMPQEDGSWDLEASSIMVHFTNMSLSLRSNNLVFIGLVRYASVEDMYVGIIAQRFPVAFNYTNVELSFTKGIVSEPSSVYVAAAGFWSAELEEEISLIVNGITTDLTKPWMEM